MPDTEVAMTSPVFVYGTLKRGEANHALLQGFRPQTAWVWGLVLHGGPGFPYACPGTGRIHGELYVIDARTRLRLDALEDHPHVYRRRLWRIWLMTGGMRWGWVYVAHRPIALGPRLPTTHWSERAYPRQRSAPVRSSEWD